MIGDNLERPPDLILTAVRTMAPVAGMPPKIPAAKFAAPCPNSSRSGWYVPPSTMPEATRAESSDSIPARNATEIAPGSRAIKRSVEIAGRTGAGNESGISPISGTFVFVAITPTETTARAARDPGNDG